MAENKQETLEEKLSQIEAIIRKMEEPEVSLEESFQLYQAGIEQLKNCNQMLDTVEKKMQILNLNGELSDF
ncbi:MAG: exodeoxyribonuclease VII small subunit [Lachnospiraceae bacterium]|nr:exodeoxyribonuclease VII small subunit [Lachnospiraceae bacterium]